MGKLWQRLIALGIVVAIIGVVAISQLGGSSAGRTPSLPPADSAAAQAALLTAVAGESTPPATPPPAAQAEPDAAADMNNRIKELEQAALVDPKNAQTFIDLGRVYFQLRVFPRAADAFANALKLDPSNATVRNDLGSTLLYQGMLELAKQEYQKAIELDAALADPHYNMAVILSHSAKPDIPGAIAEWRETIRLAPGSLLARSAEEYIKSYEGHAAAATDTPAIPPG